MGWSWFATLPALLSNIPQKVLTHWLSQLLDIRAWQNLRVRTPFLMDVALLSSCCAVCLFHSAACRWGLDTPYQVEKLSALLGVVGTEYTCETAGYFWLLHVLSR